MTGLLVLLAACGRPVDSDPGAAGALFPHPDAYPAHGADYLADPESCADCHDRGTTVLSGAGCQSCHAYPHPADMADEHGAAWQASPEQCTACHGASGAEAPANVTRATCTECHHTYPHEADPRAAHGAWVVERGGPEACRACHPAWAPGPGDCASCHPAYPHPDDWRSQQAHDRIVEPACTEQCHSADATVTCDGCHDTYPHPAGWTRGHLAPVVVRGEGPCVACHAPGTLTGPALPVTCDASCHGVAR